MTEAAMTEILLAAVQWVGLFLFLFTSCTIVTCAAEEMRNPPTPTGPVTMRDWDALNRSA
jgi:hypothetical protein